MRSRERKTSPKVIGGKVQRKNRWTLTRTYWNTYQRVPVIDRLAPGREYRHLLRSKDVLAFIDLLPDWNELSRGLDAIVLAAGDEYREGWHASGVIGICAWDRELWRFTPTKYYERDADFFELVGIPCERQEGGWTVKFTEKSAAAYQLLRVLLHELGHHHDRMTTRHQRRVSRGEGYADQYALAYERRIWDRYFDAFGWP